MQVRLRIVFGLLLVATSCGIASSRAQERSPSKLQVTQQQVFSGPQIGEPLQQFLVRGVFDQWAGKELDFVKQAANKPLVLIFVHDVNRQSIAFTRILSHYTLGRTKDGLRTGIVWLSDDLSEAESNLKRMRHALSIPTQTETGRASNKSPESKTTDAPNQPSKANANSEAQNRESNSDKHVAEVIGISLDGREGPGSYGLNRNVTLTILIAKENKVSANFALVQPSLQVDLPKVLASIVEIAGGVFPTLDQLEGMPSMNRTDSSSESPPNLRPLLAPLIRKSASDQQVDEAANAIQEQSERDPATKREVARIANTIISAGKLENYGTPRAQEYLSKWAKEYRPQ